ncbi:MAG: hypothetical protein ACI8TX_001303 [Hyphomicrobiaceae bacterium]|jgi:hypothetical protein
MHKQKTTRCFSGVLVFGFVLAALLAGTNAHARPKFPVLRQLTQLTTGSVTNVRLQGQQGETIVFLSDGDVLGPGTETGVASLYEIDVATRVVRRAFDSGGAQVLQPTRATDPDDLDR